MSTVVVTPSSSTYEKVPSPLSVMVVVVSVNESRYGVALDPSPVMVISPPAVTKVCADTVVVAPSSSV